MRSGDDFLAMLAQAVDVGPSDLCVQVTVYVSGQALSGRLVSEVNFCASLVGTVTQGQAAGLAVFFEGFSQLAEERAAEVLRRNAGRPHSTPPELPRFLHLQSVNDDRIVRVALAAVDAWMLDEFTSETLEV